MPWERSVCRWQDSVFLQQQKFIAGKGDLILVDSNLIHMTKSTSEEDEGHNRIILYVSRKKMEEMESKFPKLNLVRFFRENYGV